MAEPKKDPKKDPENPEPETPEPETDETSETEEPQQPDALLRALRQERQNAKDARKEAKAFQEQVAELTTRAATAETKLAEHETTQLRDAVAAEHNLSPSLARRLVGTTRAELEADALDLASALDVGGSFDGGVRSTRAPKSEDPNKAHGRFLARALRGEDPNADDE